MGHNSQYSFGSQYMMTAVILPVWGFAISQSGFFIWLAVRPSDFVWPGLKVMAESGVDPYLWVI